MKKSEIIMRKSPKFTLGADPEFNLFKDGKFVSASNYLHGTENKLGLDGHSTTGEMRPAAFFKSNQLHSEIEDILHELGKVATANRLEARAGSGETNRLHRDPTGGHIHYSDEVKPTANFLVACNRLFTLPLNTVSKTSNRSRYLLTNFLVGEIPAGYEGDDTTTAERHFTERAKNNRVWDTTHAHPGFEYRLVLSWLCHPVIARGTLTLAKLIGKIQIVFGDAELKLVNAENIIDYCNKFEARHVKRFYAMVAQLKRSRKYLEGMDIIKTWRVGKHGRDAKVMFNVQASFDNDLPEIFNEHFQGGIKAVKPIKFVGAGAHRSDAKMVFLPSNSLLALPGVIRWTNVARLDDYFEPETRYSTIGLSVALRNDRTTCAKVIKAIVAFLNRPRTGGGGEPAFIPTSTQDCSDMVEQLTPAQADACRDIHADAMAWVNENSEVN